MKLNCNCCDGIYNSFDVHFTSACDNNCAHCVDTHYKGIGIIKPDIKAIINTIIKNEKGFNDVLFLGGEPCLYLEDLLNCIIELKQKTSLKLYVTTSIPKICYDRKDLFFELIKNVDGINLSVQHYQEGIADKIRRTATFYNRQYFYNSLPYKEKIRINLNIVKPYLYTKEDITNCLYHYDKMKFNSIKLSEIQHGKEYYVSFSDIFNFKMESAYANGCQQYINTSKILPNLRTPLLLKRSCFLCEESLVASVADGIKLILKCFSFQKNKYGVIYENGLLQKGWI